MTNRQSVKMGTAALLLVSAGAAATASAALPAFPGAQGFAANASGGRGGDVYHVTTLADDPDHLIPGSLFYGLWSAKSVSARTIVFDVGGTIKLGSKTLDIKNIDNVTIAGQTAPTPVIIVGNTVQITSSGGDTTSNIILQHVGIRKGGTASGDALSIKGSGTTSNIMVDHVSASWSADEVISVGGATNAATNVTVQYSTMSEALTNGHQFGSLIRSRADSKVSYLHNLYSNNASRNPRPGSYLGKTLEFEFQNNVIYNWSDRAGYTGGEGNAVEPVYMNYQGNYLVAGPNTPAGAKSTTAFTKDLGDGHALDLKVFQAGNKIDSDHDAVRDGADTGWGMFAVSDGTPFPEADKRATPWAYPATAGADSADVAYAKVIAAVGMMPHARTATDQRLVNEVMTNTGVAAQSAPNAAEWAAIDTAPTVARPAGWDTEVIPGNYPGTSAPRPLGDGMPTWWETLRGFNPNVADNSVVGPDGYTRLEKYLHYLSAIATWNPAADGNWSDPLSWRGTRPETTDASANFPAGAAGARTVTVDEPFTVGQMSFDGSAGYTLAGAGQITLDVISGTSTLDVLAGSHTISAPFALADNTVAHVGPAASTLTITDLRPTTANLTKSGDGTLVVNNVRAQSLSVMDGTFAATGGTSSVNALVVAPGATLDLGQTNLVVRAAGAAGTWDGGKYTGVSGMAQRGRAGGDWDGDGLVTTQAHAKAGLTTLAVATGAEALGLAAGQTAEWAGQVVSAESTLVAYTYGGDADLNGVLDSDDYFAIDSNFNLSGSVFGFSRGDFNYDGVIDSDDYFIIDSNFNNQILGTLGPAGPGASAQSAAAVPEPATAVALIVPAAGAMLSRRRRRGDGSHDRSAMTGRAPR